MLRRCCMERDEITALQQAITHAVVDSTLKTLMALSMQRPGREIMGWFMIAMTVWYEDMKTSENPKLLLPGLQQAMLFTFFSKSTDTDDQ